MLTSQQIQEALIQLGKREGGLPVVARKIGCTLKTLQRIAKGGMGAMGNVSRMGPDLRRRLDENYPGWTTLGEKNEL